MHAGGGASPQVLVFCYDERLGAAATAAGLVVARPGTSG